MTTHTPSLEVVQVGRSSVRDQRTLLIPGMYDEILALAERTRGLKVLHLSATAYGGGVAEIMHTLVPMFKDLGVEASWQIIEGADEFFDVTKLLHNSLQGDPQSPTAEQRAVWEEYQDRNAAAIDPDDWDVIFVHDPQPLGIRARFGETKAKWAWRCHIDLSTPNPETLSWLLPYMNQYDAAFFHCDEYAPDGLTPDLRIVPPAIDPLAPKNIALSQVDANYIVSQFGVDPAKPTMCQVSRFDPWKDPLGVVDAYRILKKDRPDLQLTLIGSMASDDPEGVEYFERTKKHAAGDPDIFLLTNLEGVGAIEVNAFQVQADVLVQKSTKEGFGLTVSEALWKARPMVAGNVGGIRLQIDNGVSGWLVDSVESCAAACAEALDDPAGAVEIALRGKEDVRANFLMPRYLRDHLRLYADLAGR